MAEGVSSLEIWPSNISGAPYGLCLVAVSAVVFYLSSKVAAFTRPKIADKQKWRWKNISVSLLHAAITALLMSQK
ncbi:hypothetical protein MAR_008781 [Mya arenaria]|uniref:ATP synthase F0 subunit 8 n=1 Tax=Mya arenaria TaxID=6604 RepID=A0ABY7DWW6_MYAAR|nr:hypothetical protein MAR_008781 [Mya arenaria]